jgi:hypothetical protein
MSKYRNQKIKFLNDYIDNFILRNSLPFYFSVEKNKVIEQLREVIDRDRSRFLWRMIYCDYLFLVNRFIYKLYKNLKKILQ